MLRPPTRTPDIGEQLEQWLNDTRGTPQHSRVSHLLDCFSKVRASVTGYYFPIRVYQEGRVFSGKMPVELGAESGSVRNPTFERQLCRLRRMLRRYSFSPAVSFPLKEGAWVTAWESVKRGKHSGMTEGDAARLVWELAAQGRLDRLCRCECGCGAWIFKLRSTRRFRNDLCRQQGNTDKRKTSQFREKRARYMRKYRRTEKERDARAMRRARRAK